MERYVLNMDNLKYFYSNPIKKHNVSSESPVALCKEQAIEILYETVGDEPGCFFGVINKAGITIQFYLNDYEDNIWSEMPFPEKGGSYGTILSFDEVEDIVRNLKGDFNLSEFPNFEFEAW